MRVFNQNSAICSFKISFSNIHRLILAALVVLVLTGLAAAGASAQASNVYITPDGGGNGVCTSNTHPPSWFNNSGNWGNGATQIGPDTVVHLCGTFTDTVGATLLTAQGSGTSGHPVTILFETGTVLTSSAGWPSQYGAIDISTRSYIVVNGGSTCGWINRAVVPCNGTIQNTGIGSSGSHPSGFKSVGVYAGDSNRAGCTPGCRVTNLNFFNLYVHNSQSDGAPDQEAISAVMAWPVDGFRADHNIIHDTGWALNMHGNNQELDHNEIYNSDHGTAMGAGVTTTGMLIHDNHFHDFANWDTTFNAYHHDGVHIWGRAGISNVNHQLYNNQIDGDMGGHGTAGIYVEDSSTGLILYNNVCVMPANGNIWSGGCFGMGSVSGGPLSGVSFYNNTCIGLSGSGDCLTLNSYTGSTIKNNLIAGFNTFLYLKGGSTLGAADYNQYEAQGAVGGSNAWQTDFVPTNSFLTWQGSGARDAHGRYVSTRSENNDGTLQSGSPAIGAGTNLTSLGIAALNNDASGKRRPSSGAWDAGAYSSGTTVAAGPTPPTNLKVTVQ